MKFALTSPPPFLFRHCWCCAFSILDSKMPPKQRVQANQREGINVCFFCVSDLEFRADLVKHLRSGPGDGMWEVDLILICGANRGIAEVDNLRQNLSVIVLEH